MISSEKDRQQQNINDTPVHSEELQDIITSPPAWLIRWGIASFFLVIVSVIFISLFIRYPDTVSGKMEIRSSDNSKAIASSYPGEIKDILVKPGQWVTKGQDLAYLESNSDMQQITNILTDLMILQNGMFTGRSIKDTLFSNIDLGRLGEIQQSYQSFYLTYLSNRKLINRRSWERLPYFIQTLNTLITEVRKQKGKYVLQANITGVVHFNDQVRNGARVNAGEELFYITTKIPGFFGEMLMPLSDMEKIQIGQAVVIKVNHLPFERFGRLTGKVLTMSNLPLNNGYYCLKLSIAVPLGGPIRIEDLRTGMQGTADVVTQNVSLFSRITNNLYKKAKVQL